MLLGHFFKGFNRQSTVMPSAWVAEPLTTVVQIDCLRFLRDVLVGKFMRQFLISDFF